MYLMTRMGSAYVKNTRHHNLCDGRPAYWLSSCFLWDNRVLQTL